MSVLSLLKVTPNHKSRDTSDGDNYVWHIANRVGNNTYVCLYTVDKLHRHSASLKCVNRTGTKFTEKCPARATVTFREDIWPFIQVIKQNKYKPKYGFVGGADVITCIDNYETQLHTHKSYCQASSDPSVHCRITKHVLSCYSETEVENTAYPRLFRHDVITEAKKSVNNDLSASELCRQAERKFGYLQYEADSSLLMGELQGSWQSRGVFMSTTKKAVYWSRGADENVHKCPEDKRTMCFISPISNRPVKQQFYHKFPEMDIFVLPEELKLLQGKIWSLDGTFTHTNNLYRLDDEGEKETFCQTYIFSYEIEHEDGTFVYPVIYAVMKKRTTTFYDSLLQYIEEIHQMFNPTCDPLEPIAVSCDMEPAIIKSLKKKFGQDLKIRLCSFHVKQRLKIYLETQWSEQKIGKKKHQKWFKGSER